MTAKPRRKASSNPGWFSLWNDLFTGTRHGICLALLTIVAVGFMAPDLFSSRELVGGDIVHWKAMARSLFAWEEVSGERPLWATGPFMGMPAVEISYPHGVPQVDDLARVLREWFWPTSHLLILFAGMYGLVFHMTRDSLSGVLAAVAFGLTTYLPILLIAGHHSKYVALAFVPWLLWAFVYARRSPGLLPALLFAIATAVSLRAGHVQITYYAAFTMGIWWLVDAVRALQGGKGRAFAISTGWLLVGGGLGILMVADPYLVKAAYKEFTIRGAAPGSVGGGMSWEYAMGWSQGWTELLTLVVAGAAGNTGVTYWGPKIFTAGPHYIGGVSVLLALYAIVYGRRPAVWGLAVAALLMTGFSLGENLEPLNRLMYNHFPLFDAFRVPETWLSVVALVVAVLAGLGVRDAVRHAPDGAEEAQTTRGVERLAVGAVVVAAVLMLFGGSMLDFSRPNEIDSLARRLAAERPDVSLQDPQTQQFLRQTVAGMQDDRRELYAKDARRTFFFVLVAGGVLVAVRRRKLPGFAAQFVLVVLVAVDLGGVGRRYFNGDVLVPGRQADALVPEYDFDRWLVGKAQEAGGLGQFRVLSLEGDPVTTARPAYFHESLGGYHGAKLRRYQDFLENMLFEPGSGMPSSNVLRMTNTRYVVARGSLQGAANAYSDQSTGMTVSELTDVLPRGYFVDSLLVESDATAQWARIQSPIFDPGRMAVVDHDLGLPPVPDSVASRVTMTSYAPDRIAWNVSTDAPRLFVAAEVYYPGGWTARIDGEDAPIVPANYLLRGVVVPEGEHELVMTFEPTGRRAGLVTAWGSTLVVYGLLLWLLVGLWRQRKGS